MKLIKACIYFEFASSPVKVSTPKTSAEKGEVDINKKGGFQFAFDAYNTAISTLVRDIKEERQSGMMWREYHQGMTFIRNLGKT